MPNQHHDSERQIVNDFSSRRENTMGEVVSNSIGKAILYLKEIYFPDVKDDAILEEHYNAHCLKQLNEIKNTSSDEAVKLSIEHIIAKVGEPSDVLDRVTIVSKDLKSECYTFSLKEVLLLVWMALHDNQKFAWNYPGNPSEQLEAAKRDLPERLKSFFNCLNTLRIEQVCHQGHRNQLVFTLNGIYEKIKLIEDTRSTILFFLKEKTSSLFWQAYNQADGANQKILLNALFEWMQASNPRPILKVVDRENAVFAELRNLFIENGTHPDEIKLDDLINQALDSLEFACDPERHPYLAKINEIMKAVPIRDQGRNAAVLDMQKWVRDDFLPSKKEDQEKLNTFYNFYYAHKILVQYEKLLRFSGLMTEEFETLASQCQEFFQNVRLKKTFPALDGLAVTHLKQAVNQFKQTAMVSEIENFFTQWFDAHKSYNSKEKERLYAMLLEPKVQEKIKLTDGEIIKFISENPYEPVKDITPYQVNRVFLHAILVNPGEWTPIFAKVFAPVLEFVENSFNQSNSGLSQALKKDSYPKKLIKQLDYLLACRIHPEQPHTRPVDMLLLPEQVKKAKEWVTITHLVNVEKRDQIYQRLLLKINGILWDELKKPDIIETETGPEIVFGVWYLSNVLRSIPKSGWKYFINPILEPGYDMTRVIGKGHHWVGLSDLLDEETIQKIYEKSGEKINQLLWESIESGDLKFGAAIQSIPKNGWAALVKSIMDRGFEVASRVMESCFIPQPAPLHSFYSRRRAEISTGNKVFFINLFSPDWFQYLIRGYIGDLIAMLEDIPEGFRLTFLEEKIGIKTMGEILDILSDPSCADSIEPSLASLIKTLPKKDWQSFLIKFDIFNRQLKLKKFLTYFSEKSDQWFFINFFGKKRISDNKEIEKDIEKSVGKLLLALFDTPDDSRFKFITDILQLSVLKKMIEKHDSEVTVPYYLIATADGESVRSLLAKSPVLWMNSNETRGYDPLYLVMNMLSAVENWSLLKALGMESVKSSMMKNHNLFLMIECLSENDRWSLLSELGVNTVKSYFKMASQKAESMSKLLRNRNNAESSQEEKIMLLLAEDKKVEFQRLFMEVKGQPVIKVNSKEESKKLDNENNAEESKKMAIAKIEMFANQLKEEYATKRKFLGIFCPHTKENKAARLNKLVEAIKASEGDDWMSLIKQAKQFEEDHPFQNILSHRTKNLLQNILDGHPEKGIWDPKDKKNLLWEKATPKFW